MYCGGLTCNRDDHASAVSVIAPGFCTADILCSIAAWAGWRRLGRAGALTRARLAAIAGAHRWTLATGALTFDGAPTEGGRYVELRADLDLVVLLANAPHPLDTRPSYTASKVRLTAWRADAPADPIATAATPERARAYENSMQYVLGALS